MPITIHAHDSLENEGFSHQVERLYDTSPEFADGAHAVEQLEQAMTRGDVLYTADFNEKCIAAVWARGQGEERLIQYIVVHPSNRGRGVAEQLIKAACEQEALKGVKHFRPGCGVIHRILAHLELLG